MALDVEDTNYRDELAAERTRLANERTLLAYVRTGLGLLAAGVVVARFITGPLAAIAAFGLILGGIVVTCVGFARFRRVQQRLSRRRHAATQADT